MIVARSRIRLKLSSANSIGDGGGKQRLMRIGFSQMARDCRQVVGRVSSSSRRRRSGGGGRGSLRESVLC